MRKSIFYAAIAAFALIGCTKNEVEPVVKNEAESEVLLKVSVPVTSTKSMEATDDDVVENVQILVFNEAELLEAYASGGANDELEIKCTAGNKNVVALVNAPEMSEVSSRTSLMSRTSDLLTNNSLGRLIMEGEKPVVVSASSEAYQVVVPVRRLVSKVYLGSISLDYAADHYKYKTFTVDAVYLINVAGSKNYLTDRNPVVWYNKLKAEDSGKNPLIYDELASPATVHPSIPYTRTHIFYCYPNNASDSSAPAWSPRTTRLVVEATLDGAKCYYPVTMPEIGQNKAYKVNLVIQRPGSSSPDIPVQTYWGEGNIEVLDWDEEVVVDKEL